MVGLSVVLEGYKDTTKKSCSNTSRSSSQVVNKSSLIKTSPTSPTATSRNPFSRSYSLPNSSNLPSIGFLDHCFLCRLKLLPGKDIYMYKGDRAFCSEDCRCRQIYMDEEEILKAKIDICSMASSSSSRSSNNNSSRKGTSKRANGFAY